MGISHRRRHVGGQSGQPTNRQPWKNRVGHAQPGNTYLLVGACVSSDV